ncbi:MULTISPECIES: DUF2065 domain-containing protein [Zhongshania]|jgi:hypothetical protein|uniref:DUF2065 domain-containing protein n=2 Tax=Zhongshania TaxID=1434050 RepID=A0A127M2K1_9GAMM|nr:MULTISPECIES: DUF2065 domain-containing protein [Zhongshania]AMO67450.1 hypothetical protein AZF00_03655 [Zhongshania aliphaticivorans]EIF42956.1 hypothetical protein DOK_11459 [gamma proteobacterium BDW918]MBB5188986.1 hypothetical protein [Zhongshania antarctica]|tara:strand:+ start:37044 stop:37229 length:186 start_codon:yes stop_codon:yes gene_type:complete
MWQELSVALSMVLIIEGVLPFLSPERWRLLAYRMADMDSRSVRIAGLVSMLAGLILLSLLR